MILCISRFIRDKMESFQLNGSLFNLMLMCVSECSPTDYEDELILSSFITASPNTIPEFVSVLCLASIFAALGSSFL